MGQAGARVRIEVLGPIRVLDGDGRDITPDGELQRRLLSLLTLRVASFVPADEAFEVLWPTALPRDPAAALQNHVSRLRRVLPAGAIEAAGSSYRLDGERVDIDVDELHRAVHQAAAGPDGGSGAPAGEVIETIDALLARWSGPAHPELVDLDDGRIVATRLEDLRVRAREARAEASLAAGRTDGVAAELAALADAEPLRERPRALLMEALAATGRRVEALRVYDDFRRTVGDELGIEPSPALVAQHAELLRGAAPGASAVWRPAHRLPLATSSLVGRDELLAAVVDLASDHRLVTLVGPGGVGKSRLVIEVGHRLASTDRDRAVVLCELAAADEATAADAVASALGIDARPGVPAVERIVEVVGTTRVVVLLDNCEHVLDPVAALVERVLGACPGVIVLATSQERLRVAGEHVRPVPPLALDDDHAPAVRLFLDRARAVAPDFVPDARARAGIDEIVRRLDGLPLAIELAAARLHTHDVGEVAAGLDQRFSLLSSGYRTSTRHASLATAVSWSVDLLPADLQTAFADLSVFSGSFSLSDAVAVWSVDRGRAADDLTQLVERSLVVRVPGRRYLLLETLRAFGADQLAATGRASSVSERHAHRQVAWVDDARRRLLATDDLVLAEIDRAVPELRTALTWLLGHGDVDRASTLVVALFDYGYLRLRPDVLGWSEQVLAARAGDDGPGLAPVWVVAAYAAWMGGDLPEAERRATAAWRAAEVAGSDPPAMVASIQASVALFEGRLTEAAAWYRRSVELADDAGHRSLSAAGELLALGYAGDPAVTARAEQLLADVGGIANGYAAHTWYCAGEAVLAVDVELARARLGHALELAAATHATFVTGVAGASKASIDARLGDPRRAAAEYRQLIDHWRRAGMWSTQWTVLRSIAGLLARLGRHRDAAVLEGAVRSTQSGHRIFGSDAQALDDLGARLRAALGDEVYEAAVTEGCVLDGDAAVEHALRAL